MKILSLLFGIIIKNVDLYDDLKSDDEKRQKSNALGIWSIVSTLVGTILAVGIIWGLSFLFDIASSLDSLNALLTIIGIFLLILVLVVLLLQLIVNGLVSAILQLKLNKKPIGIASLVLWLLAVIAAVIIVAVVIF